MVRRYSSCSRDSQVELRALLSPPRLLVALITLLRLLLELVRVKGGRAKVGDTGTGARVNGNCGSSSDHVIRGGLRQEAELANEDEDVEATRKFERILVDLEAAFGVKGGKPPPEPMSLQIFSTLASSKFSNEAMSSMPM